MFFIEFYGLSFAEFPSMLTASALFEFDSALHSSLRMTRRSVVSLPKTFLKNFARLLDFIALPC